MLRWLKKHFIPHDGNDHQPHFLRSKNIRFLLTVVFVVEICFYILPLIPGVSALGNRFMAAVLPSVLDDLSNQNRQAEHLSVLTVNPILNKVAELKAHDMAEKSYFAHVSPEGKAPWYWFEQAGYKYEYAGENLAIDFIDSQDVAVAWMNSPTHRANIVKGDYTEMGTGVAEGVFEGSPTIFVSQVYAKPLAKKVIEEPVQVVTPVPEKSLVATSSTEIVATSTLATLETATSALPVAPSVLGSSTASVASVDSEKQVPAQAYKQASLFQKYITSPRHIVNGLFIAIALLTALALSLKLFVRIDKRHPALITNGFAVLVIVFGLYSLNSYVAHSKAQNFTSFMGFENTSEVR